MSKSKSLSSLLLLLCQSVARGFPVLFFFHLMTASVILPYFHVVLLQIARYAGENSCGNHLVYALYDDTGDVQLE
jgi:hypothetical protein